MSRGHPAIALALALLLAGCAGTPAIPAARFVNGPVWLAVDDRRDVPRPPAAREFLADVYFFDASIERPLTRALELPRPRRALGVNAIDEVPDSTWFTNRIGVRSLTPDEVRAGPVTHDPDANRPWAIQSTKGGGTTAGFIVTDAAHVKYLLKFDRIGDPAEMATGTHIIVNRLMWACGYNVAEDQILYIRREDLIIAPGAKVKDDLGHTTGVLDEHGVDDVLKHVRHEPDGRIRTLASRWIEGKTIGGHPGEGVRADDPNDRIPHEARRDLRGMLPIDAWLDAVDVTEGQFVDAWVADATEPSRHYVKHYAIDFGKSLGAMGAIDHDWWRGHAYRIDLPAMLHAAVSLGLDARAWEHRDGPTDLSAVSHLFDVASLEPGSWHPDTPGYLAFRDADRIDELWGTKLVARFTREQLHAAVEAARLTDPRATAYLTDTLVGRQRVLAAYWFARVPPLDRFTVEGDPRSPALCFDDLALALALTPAASTSYTITSYDWHGHAVGVPIRFGATATGAGHTCSPALPVAPAGDAYTIYRIDIQRTDYAGPTYAHVARDPVTSAIRLIGIWRP